MQLEHIPFNFGMKQVDTRNSHSRIVLIFVLYSPLLGQGISLVTDEDIESKVIEVVGDNISDVYITCPPSKSLGIKLPILVLHVKNVSDYELLNFLSPLIVASQVLLL
jgi:hypothetical protein